MSPTGLKSPHFAFTPVNHSSARMAMAANLGACTRASTHATHRHSKAKPLFLVPLDQPVPVTGTGNRNVRSSRMRVSNDGKSYLDMWRNAVDRERKEVRFRHIAEKLAANVNGREDGDGVDLDKKSRDFKKILEVSKEERDSIQRMQVIDRAAAAIEAARSILNERLPGNAGDNGNLISENGGGGGGGGGFEVQQGGIQDGSIIVSQSDNSRNGVPGPDFWSWTPLPDSNFDSESDMHNARKPLVYPTLTNPVMVKERSMDFLAIPFESKLSEANRNPHIPPLQALLEVENSESSDFSKDASSLEGEERELGVLFSAHAAEAAHALNEDKTGESVSHGVNPDGSRWWKETGIERRTDGVICRWTMTRGVSASKGVEWQEKFWEAADELGYKELGSEKSGRDATGNVWREYWRESMWQGSGLVHLEKAADKWGKNGKGDEWQEEWWEHYNASGQAEKWAHKWCSIDPSMQLEAGHAHVWHERWGEKYDGHGGSIKYTDKWAERCEGDRWTKWGDKWDENFNPNGHGVKQGETWWEGKHGERWNRTWGEHHNGSGWVHKYGKSSSGEHWDTHVEQETWYERFPHYGFCHCFNNSIQLQEVRKPSEIDQP